MQPTFVRDLRRSESETGSHKERARATQFLFLFRRIINFRLLTLQKKVLISSPPDVIFLLFQWKKSRRKKSASKKFILRN